MSFQPGDKATFNKDYRKNYTYEIVAVFDVGGVEHVAHRNVLGGNIFGLPSDQFTKVEDVWEAGKSYQYAPRFGSPRVYRVAHVDPFGAAVAYSVGGSANIIGAWTFQPSDRKDYKEYTG